MDGAVGDGNKYTGEGWTNSTSFYVAKKSTAFHWPGPSDCWVFTDEHPDSIDDGILYTPNYPFPALLELPGCQHAGSCGLTFADGHSEIHKWRDPRTIPPLKDNFTLQLNIPSPNNQDIAWLQDRTTGLK